MAEFGLKVTGTRAHEVDIAVELIMDSGDVVIVSWQMDGVNEGSEIESRSTEDVGSLPGDGIDVSSYADWSRLLGCSIVGISTAWYAPNEGCPEIPWAFRFSFAENSHALGGSEDELEYSPDSLVVILDEEAATSYRIPDSSTSSYG